MPERKSGIVSGRRPGGCCGAGALTEGSGMRAAIRRCIGMNARDIVVKRGGRPPFLVLAFASARGSEGARRAYAEWGDNDAHGAGNGPWSHFGDDR